MEYRFYGDELQLLRYRLRREEEVTVFGADGSMMPAEQIYEEYAAADAEKDAFLQQYPNAEIERIDNTGCEWMDGLHFTQKQREEGGVELAQTLGEKAYREHLLAADRDAQMLDLDYRLSLLELGAAGGELQ